METIYNIINWFYGNNSTQSPNVESNERIPCPISDQILTTHIHNMKKGKTNKIKRNPKKVSKKDYFSISVHDILNIKLRHISIDNIPKVYEQRHPVLKQLLHIRTKIE